MDDAAVSHILLSILSLAFMGWAGIVWRGTEAVKSLLLALDVKVTGIMAHIDRLDAELGAHEAMVAHPGAMEMHAREAERIDVLRRDVDELRGRRGGD